MVLIVVLNCDFTQHQNNLTFNLSHVNQCINKGGQYGYLEKGCGSHHVHVGNDHATYVFPYNDALGPSFGGGTTYVWPST